MFSRMSRRDRLLICLVAIVAIGFLFYKFIYIPFNDKLAALDEDIRLKESIIEKHKETIAKMPEMQERYAQLEYIEKEKLPDRITSVDEMLQVLVDESKKSGVLITSYKPTEGEESTEVSIAAEGTYEELLVFLNGIDRLSGQVEFGNITVSRKGTDGNMLNITGSLLFSEEYIIGGDLL